MWKPPINFITLHYAWIIFAGLLALVVIYPYGNVSAIDAWFFGASASTESGLNTVDVKDLKLYQQLYLYAIPIITNLGFVNIIVVAVRLMWFEKRFKAAAASLLRPVIPQDIEAHGDPSGAEGVGRVNNETKPAEPRISVDEPDKPDAPEKPATLASGAHIMFAQDVKEPPSNSTLYIPPPRERDEGHSFVEKNTAAKGDDDNDEDVIKPAGDSDGLTKRRPYRRDGDPSMSRTKSIERAAASIFVLGKTSTASPRPSTSSSRWADLPYLSRQVTVGRNSNFQKLTAEDRERLGGIEYRALKLLLKIVSGTTST